LTKWDSKMVPAPAPLRVNNKVFPSSVKVGEPSFADPETTPGANTVGASAVTGAANALPKEQSRKTVIAR